MADGITEDQRRRMEVSRQRALERVRERRVNSNSSTASMPLLSNNNNNEQLIQDGGERSCHSAVSASACNDVAPVNNAEKPARESFGDSSIDWTAAAGDMDRLLATSSSNTNASGTNNAHNNNNNDIMPRDKRQKIQPNVTSIKPQQPQQHNSQKSAGLSDEQRARMELNRQRALEKKQQTSCQSTLSQPTATATSTSTVQLQTKSMNSSLAASTTPAAASMYTDQQKARMEENKLKALAKRQQQQQQQQMSLHNTTEVPSIQQTNNTASSYNEEQRARMEENRRRALEKRAQQKTPSSQMTADSSAVTSAIQETNSVIQCPPAAAAATASVQYNDEQRARMEENRRRALERKQQRMQQQQQQSLSLQVPPSCTVSATAPQQGQLSSLQARTSVPAAATAPQEQVASSSASGSTPNVNHDETSTLESSSHPPTTNYNDEQRARMEDNRQKALERKQQQQSLSQASNTSIVVPPVAAAVAQQQAEVATNSPSSASGTLANLNNQETSTQASAASPPTKLPPPSATPDKHKKKPALPPLPEDLQYDESRLLPVVDDEEDEDEYEDFGDSDGDNDLIIDRLIQNAEVDEPLLNGMNLYDHQKAGVIRALQMRRLILAFDMGLGKTIIGCVWAKAFLKTFQGIKVFIIAPVSLHDDWRRTAIDATGLKLERNGGNKKKKGKKKKTAKSKKKKNEKEEDTEKTVTGKRKKKKPKKVDSDSDSEVEDESEEEPEENDFDLYVYSWQSVNSYKNVISDINDYVVICDEAHHMQNMSSKRTEEALKLMFPKKCRGVLLLSGTPMKNGKPSNLFPLLKAVRHPFGDHQKKYEFFFCNGQQKKFRGGLVWDASGSSNLHILNAHTTSHIFRMTKEECMKELPPRKREVKKIPVAPLHESRYKEALKDLAYAFTTSSGGNGLPGGSGEGEDILKAFGRMRTISANAKVDAIVGLAVDILNEESSIVIFTTFVAVAKLIHEKLDERQWAGELLTGETVPKKRQATVDRFQAGLSPVFVCTYGAGGVGLTLTAACTVILVDRPWTPGDVNQAEDRVRRIGQKRPTRSVWIQAFPIDKQIDELIDNKEENSNTVVDGKAGESKNKSAPKISIRQLVQSVLSTENGS